MESYQLIGEQYHPYMESYQLIGEQYHPYMESYQVIKRVNHSNIVKKNALKGDFLKEIFIEM